MNLRAKKSKTRRKTKKNEKSLALYFVFYSFIIVCLTGTVFVATLYYNGQCEKINKQISINDLSSYRLEREIQNLKIKLENLSRKEFIVAKIKQYNLGLHTPEPFQVVHLDSNEANYRNDVRKLAYNSR